MHFGLYHKPGGALSALGHALPAAGQRVTWRRPNVFHRNDVEPFDVVVTLGLRGQAGEVQRAYSDRGIPVVVVDVGHLRRERGYRRYVLDGLHWLPAAAGSADRVKALELDVRPRRSSSGGEVLVCGQVPEDAAHGMPAEQLAVWFESTIKELRQHTDKPIVWRPHPDAPNLRVRNADRVESAAFPLFGAIYDAVVTHTSTTGLEALIAGLPVLCHESAFYAECANTDWSVIDEPSFPTNAARMRLLRRIAYAQWTDAEVRSGEAVDFLLACLRGDASEEPPVDEEVAEEAPPPEEADSTAQPFDFSEHFTPRVAAALGELGDWEFIKSMSDDELLAVRGVGPKTVAKIRQLES